VSAISADDGEIADTESHGWAAVTGWFTGGVHPVELLKNFLDPRRLAVGGALAALDEPATTDEIEERTGCRDATSSTRSGHSATPAS
jgi:hypothetical protein